MKNGESKDLTLNKENPGQSKNAYNIVAFPKPLKTQKIKANANLAAVVHDFNDDFPRESTEMAA